MFYVIKRRSLVFAVVFLLLFTVMSLSVSTSGASAVFFGGSTRKVPVYGVEVTSGEKLIALTFDAAWGADKTQAIIDILKEYDAEGTFFLVGFWLDKYEAETKAIAEAGIEIGNHSNNHLNMPNLSEGEIRKEIDSVNDRIVSLTGKRPVYFRAPYGDYNNRLLDTVTDLGMVGVQWSIDTLDWKGLSGKAITERVMTRAKSGDIVLFHNNSDHVLDALPLILIGLKNAGFKFVGLSKLVMTENYYIDNNGIQHLKTSV